MTKDTEIRAIARCEGHLDSSEARFKYTMDMENGVESIISAEGLIKMIDSDTILAIQDVTISVYDASGKTVISSKEIRSGETISFAGLSSGIYLIRANSKIIRVVR
ncbi:MAG: T9SS type A sorting domain-containing protein [Muribaculaceae bacterium]|nr:T9SS type A sorting domain-containing protein [Muribaculaceae bacterium]